jgi:hypothetical protein
MWISSAVMQKKLIRGEAMAAWPLAIQLLTL